MRYTRNGLDPTSTTGTLIAGTSANITIGAGTVVSLKAITFKSGYNDSSVTSGYFDNQNSGGNGPIPRQDESKSEGGSAKAEVESKEKKLAQSASALRDEEGTNLSRYQFNLWKSFALVNDPELSLGWTKKGSQNQQSDSLTSGSRSVIYTLDLMGNRTNVSEDGVNKSYTVNSLNQYSTGDGLAVSNGASHEISAYNNIDYDYIGDTYLAKATAGSNSYTLYYDALGRCVKRTSVTNGGTATTNYYLFDGEHWVVEYDTQNTIASNSLYGRGIDEIIARGIKDVGGYFYFPDRNGNISVVTDGTTMIRESYRYDAFGLPTIFDPDGSPTVAPTESEIGNKFMFTGREWNSAFGFYEYRARAYNPTLGRFMSEDPKGFDAGDYNLYRYCGNDPLDKTDPMGLSEITIEIARTESVIQTHSGVPQATMGNFKMSVSGSSHSFGSVSGVTMEPPRLNFNMNKQAGVAKQYPVPAGKYDASYGKAGPTGENFKVDTKGTGFSGVWVHAGSNPQSTEGCVLVGQGSHMEAYTPGAPKAGVASYPTLDGSSAKMGEMIGLYKQVQAADKQEGEKTTVRVIIKNGN